jgi:hypothetical protein
MSAPPRGPYGGGTTSGRPAPHPGSRGRGAARGSTSSHVRGRGGRGRGAASTTNPKAEGFLQGLQTGSLNKRGSTGNTQLRRGEMVPYMRRKCTEMCSTHSLEARPVPTQPKRYACSASLLIKGPSSATRGMSRSTRGRGAMQDTANTPFVSPPPNNARANPSHKDFMMEMTAKFQDVS